MLEGQGGETEATAREFDAEGFSEISFGASAGRIVLSSPWERVFPKDVGKFLQFYFEIDDLQRADIVRLYEWISTELLKRVKPAFQYLGNREILSFSKSLEHISEAYRTDMLSDFDAQAKLFGGALSLRVGEERMPFAGSAPGRIKPVGIADLKVVRQQLQKYALGEIAHIENVLKGERRLRKHHRGEKVEQTFAFEEEETTTTEKDLQTTERFELAQELESVLSEKQKTEAGLKVSGTYGVVTVAANAGMSTEQSLEESARTARSYARETISKASERIERRTKKQSTIVTTFETSEDNEHEFSAPDDSVVGVYRWVEKHYFCQSFNYGARLMFEVSIPEPAAFYLYAQDNRPNGEADLRPPEPPNFSAADVTMMTYLTLAGRYGASVSTPPPAVQTARVFAIQGGADSEKDSGKVTIDNGWEMISASPIASCRINNANASFSVLISPSMWKSSDKLWYPAYYYPGVRGELAVAFNGVYVEHFAVSVNLLLSRTPEAYASWQLSTYNAIIEAYLARKSDYERKVAAMQARRPSASTRTDAEYREIERNELKRASIQLITGQDFSGFNSMSHPDGRPPLMDPDEALIEGNFVGLVENAFEWAEMVYEFFPYFWGSDSGWINSFSSRDEDPVFQRFLRAGFGRAVIPVRRGSERHLFYYIETGEIWSGAEPPVINDPAHLAYIVELEELNADESQTPSPEGAPWRQVVPSSLVCLEGTTLPSWEIEVADDSDVYLPSRQTCRGVPFNEAQWPADLKAVVGALGDLGYLVEKTEDPIAYLRSPVGTRIVQSFQAHANKVGVSARLGRPLEVDGIVGPCTLRGLTVATAMLRSGQWPRPY